MTYPKDIKIAAPEQFALLNDPDFLNQAVTTLPPAVPRSGDHVVFTSRALPKNWRADRLP